jgi:hypothetical protein
MAAASIRVMAFLLSASAARLTASTTAHGATIDRASGSIAAVAPILKSSIVATVNGAIRPTMTIAMIAETVTTVETTMIAGIAMTAATAMTGLLPPTETN